MKQIVRLQLQSTLPFILVFAGILGLTASFALTYDKLQVLKDISYIPACNINPIFSCGSVMATEQASLLGVPNTVFGLIGFTALTTFGFLLLAGGQFKRWIWILLQLAVTIGAGFMHYLFFQGVYRIGAICPWCFLVWIITIPTFWYVTVYNLRLGNIRLPHKIAGLNAILQKYHANILLGWYLIIFAILLQRFWYYWSTLI